MAQIPHADAGLICPLHRVDVSEVCHTCPWWTQVRGKHPQSESEIDQWACAISFLPMLLVENAQRTRETGAAVESFRNEVARTQQAIAAVPPKRIG